MMCSANSMMSFDSFNTPPWPAGHKFGPSTIAMLLELQFKSALSSATHAYFILVAEFLVRSAAKRMTSRRSSLCASGNCFSTALIAGVGSF